ncbi:MAG TPA: hypothetical protein VGF07_11300 [Stellaceae bacterium]
MITGHKTGTRLRRRLSAAFRPGALGLAIAIGALVGLAAGDAAAQLKPNQTNGFAANELVTLTYRQNFDCVEMPKMDLDFNKKKAESDPAELQTPICQVVTEPKEDPTGGSIKRTAHLYVLVPMFGTSKNPADAMQCPDKGRPGELCGKKLGAVLISLFGHIPDAWRTKPSVQTQCPDPSNPVPGTCTMHASSVDLSVLLAGMPGIPNPPKAPIFVPTPNHSHVIDDVFVNIMPIWWEVRPVLVMNRADWPTPDGKHGITSVDKMDAAEAKNRAIEVGSNFFLFFGSKQAAPNAMAGMAGMHQ